MQFVAADNLVPKSIGYDAPLKAPHRYDPVVSQGLERSSLNESHEESETNEDHDMNVLVGCIFVLNVVFLVSHTHCGQRIRGIGEFHKQTPQQDCNSLHDDQEPCNHIDT